MKITTYRSDNNSVSGYLIPIWSALESPDLRPDQVYITTVAPYSHKGPHLHLSRRGCFTCISGDVLVVTARVEVVPTQGKDSIDFHRVIPGSYQIHASSASRNRHQRVVVPTGLACCLYNPEGREAVVLNLPAPAWSEESKDEWRVEGWQDPGIGELLKALEKE